MPTVKLFAVLKATATFDKMSYIVSVLENDHFPNMHARLVAYSRLLYT